jgi:hypothetical protein
MLDRIIAGLVLPCVFAGAVGCATASMGETSAEQLRYVPGDLLHEWSKVMSTKSTGSGTSHVGFLDRRFSDQDPEGKTFVFDLRHQEKGFVLSDGKAYLFRYDGGELEVEDLGNAGFGNGVKKILQVAGAVEYELVTSSSVNEP